MAKSLPPRPDLEWLKKTAKQRLADLRADDAGAKLHHAQHAIAEEYGFKNWRALKAHVDAASLDGEIIAAVIAGKADELAALVDKHPAKLRVTGGAWDRPLLHLAAEGGHLDCVELLLLRGFSINLRDRWDNATALHWAAQGGHLAVMERLLAAGADIDGTGDAHEVGVVGWATCFRDVRADTAEFLLARGAKPTIFSAVALDRADLVRQLVQGDRLLVAAKMSRFEQRRTPLHLAVLKNRPRMVALLLELGADPSAKDDSGSTPLNLVAAPTDKSVAGLLIAAGANPEERGVSRFLSSVPILNVRNVPASIDYYVHKLGFEKEWDWGAPPTFGCVWRDQVRIFLCEGGQGAPGTWISIFVQNVDALYEDYQRRGAIIRQAPANFPWGVREMNVQDLDGHRLRMGSDATGPSDEVDLAEEP
jgi:catechol 2,3-dioxygenase-like lactoylglutathione lyase family enzyme